MEYNMYIALEQSNKLGNVKSRVWEVFPHTQSRYTGVYVRKNTHSGLHGLIHG